MGASAVLKLQKVGFTVEQVEALADFMDTQAASKADLGEAKADLKGEMLALRADLVEVEHHLGDKLATVKADLETKLADTRSDLLKWMFGTIVAQTGLLIAAIKLLH